MDGAVSTFAAGGVRRTAQSDELNWVPLSVISALGMPHLTHTLELINDMETHCKLQVCSFNVSGIIVNNNQIILPASSHKSAPILHQEVILEGTPAI